MAHLSKVSQAVAAALALGAAASAQAVTLGQVPAGNILYISGSPVINPVLIAYMVNSVDLICNAELGQISTYTTNDPEPLLGAFNAVACAAGSNIPGVQAGTSIAIIKEYNGESLNGTLPIESPTQYSVTYPVVSGIDSYCTAGTPISQRGEQTLTPYTCTGYGLITSSATTGPYAALGFVDVEAQILGVQPTGIGTMNSVDAPIGVVVSLGLYHALQGAENLPEDDVLADMPSLTRAQLATIFNGQGGLSDWTHVFGAGTGSVGAQSVHLGNSGLSGGNHDCYDGTANSTAADCQGQSTQASVAVTPANTKMYFCERGQTSGIQDAAEIFFGNIGCPAAMLTFQPPSKPGTSCAEGGCGWSGTIYDAALVFAGNGQLDELACLEGHDELGEFAIGYATTDQQWGALAVNGGNTEAADWRFIRVDGYAPSIENVAAGKYDFWAQSAAYYAESGAPNYPSGAALSLLNVLTGPTDRIGPGAAAANDYALEQTAPRLDGGVLAIPDTGNTNAPNASLATFQSNPVNNLVRSFVPRNCQPPYFPSLPTGTSDMSTAPTWDPVSLQ